MRANMLHECLKVVVVVALLACGTVTLGCLGRDSGPPAFARVVCFEELVQDLPTLRAIGATGMLIADEAFIAAHTKENDSGSLRLTVLGLQVGYDCLQNRVLFCLIKDKDEVFPPSSGGATRACELIE